MGVEIERKYLVTSGEYIAMSTRVIEIRQGYLSLEPSRTVRVRLEGERGVLNIKCRSGSIARSEFEYEIPLDEAKALLDWLDPEEIIEKTRHTFEELGSMWEVDEFEGANAGLVIAEIELDDPDQAFARPAWLGEEVSSISRYFNAELSRKPYSSWNAEEKGA